MGIKRQPKEIWSETRKRVLARDGYRCVHCGRPLTIHTAQIDHIQSGRHGSNADSNLRSLCKVCHATRLDNRHRGLIGKLLASGEVGANWRELLWE